MNQDPSEKKTQASPMSRGQLFLIGLICVLLVVVTAFISADVAALRRSTLPAGPRHHARDFFTFLRTPRQALPAKSPLTVQNTQSWMTFDYLNKTYGLPPRYLQTALHITDTHYPNISIKRFAQDLHTSTPTTITSIEREIRQYTTSTRPWRVGVILQSLLTFVLLYKYVAIFVISFFAALSFPLPSSAVLIASAFFATEGYFNFILVYLIALIANIASDIVAYWLARWYGEKVFFKSRVKKSSRIANDACV
jgi:hypothetical protein